MVSEWRQHGDEVAASRCQTQDTEPVDDIPYIGDGGEQPVEVTLVDPLREEGDNSEQFTGSGTKFYEHRGGQRELDRGGEAVVVFCLQHACLSPLPLHS